jgi:hypothetical protein
LVSLHQELDALTARIAANQNVPRRVVAQLMAAIKEQIASGKSEHSLKAGDADGQVAADFGLRYGLSAQMIELHKQHGRDLRLINGEAGRSLLMPARYVIARDGVVAYAEVNPDYAHRAEPKDLLPILDQLARSTSAPGRSCPTLTSRIYDHV